MSTWKNLCSHRDIGSNVIMSPETFDKLRAIVESAVNLVDTPNKECVHRVEIALKALGAIE